MLLIHEFIKTTNIDQAGSSMSKIKKVSNQGKGEMIKMLFCFVNVI